MIAGALLVFALTKGEKMNTDEMKTLEAEIKLKRLQLKQLKREQRRASKKPFLQTNFGRAYLHTLAAMTKPFRTVNEFAQAGLAQPEVDILILAQQTLEQAYSLSGSLDPEAPEMTNNLAKVYLESAGTVDEFTRNKIKEEIERLRSPESKLQAIELKAKLLEAFQGV